MSELPKRTIQRALRLFRTLMIESKAYLKDNEKLKCLLNEAITRGKQIGRKNLSNVWEDLNTVVRLAKAWKSGSYSQVPQKSLVAIVAAILYLVNPLDVIPDFIPGVGYLDDAAILTWVLEMIADDLEGFRQWESSEE